MPDKTIIAFLPYIRTGGRCQIRGVEFRCIKDLDKLDADAKKHVEILGQMFFTCQGGRIAEPTFAVVSAPDNDALAKAHSELIEAQLLVTYLYGSPHPTPTISDHVFLGAECSTLFTFTPNRVVSSLVATTKSEVEHGRVIVDGAGRLT